jgi:hypothetical protein
MSDLLLPSCDDLRNGMSNNDTGFLSLLLRKPTSNADLEGRYGLPAGILGIDAEAEWEGFKSCNEDTICETLWSLAVNFQ